MNQFKKGMQVVHKKMELMATVRKVKGTTLSVEIARNVPLQAWKNTEVEVWDMKDEMKKRLRKGGYIRDVFSKRLI